MEKNQLNPDLPPEVLFHIFVGLQPLDLCAIELVCKLWGEAVDGNVWKEVGKREFALPADHKDLARQAKKMSKINYNIRRGRCVMTVLAVASDRIKKDFLIGYTSFNENTVAVNWIRRSGHGSGRFDYSAEAAIIDMQTRSAKVVQPASDHNLVLHGPYLTQISWNGYNVALHYTNVNHAEITDKNQVQTGPSIPFGGTSQICVNEDPALNHFVALADLSLVNGTGLGDLNVRIYNFAERRFMETIKLEKFGTRDYLYNYRPSIVFRGHKVYCLQREATKTLIEVDVHKPDVLIRRDMPMLPETAVLTGLNDSFVFGLTQNRQAWCYNLTTASLATYPCEFNEYVLDVKWHCGLLVVYVSYRVLFVDPKAEGQDFKVVATFAADPLGNCEFQTLLCENGRILLSGIYGSVKMLDFEHATDEIQLLAVTGPEKSDMKTHDIKAYQLTETLTKLFGTNQWNTRYIGEDVDYRIGMAYVQQKSGGKVSIDTKIPYGHREYTSPYFPYSFTLPAVPATGNSFTHLTLQGTHQMIVLFCERFDGEKWMLGKPTGPEQWQEGLEAILSAGNKCLVQ